MAFIKLFLSTLICTIFFDLLWLGVFAKNFYDTHLGSLLRKSGEAWSPNWFAAIVVYLALTIGILFFVLPKTNGDLYRALWWGGLFGAVTYGIYDFTNLALLANWSFKVSVVDFIWGIIFCSIVSVFAMYMENWLL